VAISLLGVSSNYRWLFVGLEQVHAKGRCCRSADMMNQYIAARERRSAALRVKYEPDLVLDEKSCCATLLIRLLKLSNG
jgi:hypothetical protein